MSTLGLQAHAAIQTNCTVLSPIDLPLRSLPLQALGDCQFDCWVLVRSQVINVAAASSAVLIVDEDDEYAYEDDSSDGAENYSVELGVVWCGRGSICWRTAPTNVVDLAVIAGIAGVAYQCIVAPTAASAHCLLGVGTRVHAGCAYIGTGPSDVSWKQKAY